MFCFYYRWLISQQLNAGQELRGAAARHAQSCAGCAAYHRAAGELGARLTAQADAGKDDLPSNLHARILARLAEPPPALTLPARVSIRPRLVWAAAILLVCGLVLRFTVFQPRDEIEPPRIVHQPDLPDATPVVDLAQQAQTAVTDPFASERDRLWNDVRNAGGFLLACLGPDSLPTTQPAP